MSFEFTDDGLSIQTYQEIYDELVIAYTAIYGADVNFDADSPDGQRVGIEAKARLDMQVFALDLYNQLDPDFATGEMLNTIIKWAGLTLGAPSLSQVDVTITTDRALSLPIDYTVEDDLGQAWVTTAITPLLLGANTVTLVAELFGAVAADAATVTSPVTIVIGVVSVTNPLAATVGSDEETEPELRIRRNKSLQNPATSTLGGLFAALGDLAGVTDLATYENDTSIYDSTLALNPNSIWCVVEGGVAADIIEIIAKNKTGGTGIKGGVLGTFEETLFKPDGTPYTIAHDMAFDRPTEVPMYLTLTVEGIDGAAVNTAAIKAALVARTFSIAEIASASALYATVYGAASNFVATLLRISDDDATFVDSSLDPEADGKFTIATVNIDITDIT